jgi:methionyl-tRNA formyltransferase
MKYIFFGSPKFASIILEKLVEADFVPEAVVCNPDELVGRKKILTPPAIKELVLNKKLKAEILQPKKLSEIKNQLAKFNADVFVIAAYNKIISEEIINIPKFKTVGIHPSLLPKYRGASPIQTAILNGEKQTGVDLFLIDKEIDHGPILASAKCDISEKDNYETMIEKLASLGAKLLIENISKYLSGELKPQEQNHSKVTFTKKFETEDGRVDLEKDSPELIFNKIRALSPDPGVFTMIKTNPPAGGRQIKRVKLLEANLNNGKLELLKVQPEGKKPMSYKDFLNGLKNSN